MNHTEKGGDKPILAISDAAILEGDSGTKSIDFVITSDRPVEKSEGVTVDYVISNGSAIAGSDYNTFSGSTVTLPIINGDLEIENDEDFFVTLSSSDALFLDDTGRGVIINDDYNITINAATAGSPFTDGNLTTQIVNQSFDLTISAYNDTLGKPAADMNITRVDLIDASGSVLQTLFNSIATIDTTGLTTINVIVPAAYKDATLLITGTYKVKVYQSQSKRQLRNSS